jgi:hypothetical protein
MTTTTEPQTSACPSWCIQTDHSERGLHLGAATWWEGKTASTKWTVELLLETELTDPAATVIRLTALNTAFMTRDGEDIEVETWLTEPELDRLIRELVWAKADLQRVVTGPRPGDETQEGQS